MFIRAAVIVPLDQPPAKSATAPAVDNFIHDGVVECADGLVLSISRNASSASPGECLDLGDVALLPGFVNAHTHLELTHLAGRVPIEGDFVRWIEQMIAFRMNAANAIDPEASLRAGVAQSLAAGVTTVGDIGYGERQARVIGESPLRAVCFQEIVGIGSKTEAGEAAAASAWNKTDVGSNSIRIGLSPHAPYSTSAAVYRACAYRADEMHWPLATHLAESEAELRFTRYGDGPFRDLLEGMGLLSADFEPPGCSPIAFARACGVLEQKALVAHANVVDLEDIRLLATSGASVAYCPRTHAAFGHAPHRFRDMLQRGVNVCIATDSLATAPTLSVLDELRFLYSWNNSLSPQVLLEMGTIRAAMALGMDANIGSIAPGKRADFVAIPIDPRGGDPLEQILTNDVQPSHAFIDGSLVHSNNA